MSVVTPPADEAAVRACFDMFARFGETGVAAVNGMTSRNFVKLFKDCDMVDKKLTLTVLDLCFTKAKINAIGQAYDSASKRINYDQFLLAVELCANETGRNVADLHAKIAAGVSAGGPIVNATIAEKSRFHDDKSTFTAALRGSHKPLSRGDSVAKLPTPTKPANNGALREVFDRFSRFGETPGVGLGGMANRNFVKLFKDCGLEDKKLTPTVLDIAFTKAARAPVGSAASGAVSSNRINYEQFLIAVELCAIEKGVDALELHGAMVSHAEVGPVVTATVAEPNKFHDDKSTFTAKLRGSHAPLSKGDSSKSLPLPVIPEDHARVSAVFERYCRFGETAGTAPTHPGLTTRNLVKLFKDCELEDRVWSPALLDVCFAKAKNAPHGLAASDVGGKRLNYEQFLVVLELCAQEKGVASSDIHARIAAHALSGPVVQATVAEPNKFYDDKTTWTANLRGSHAPLSKGDSTKNLPTPTKPVNGDELAAVFDKYMRFGETGNTAVTGITSRNFVKLFKDTGLSEDRRLATTFLDLAFTKAKAAPVGKDSYDAQSKRLNYEQFLVALELCAQEKGVSVHDIHRDVVELSAESGPIVHATEASFNKFHDDKSTFTANLRGSHTPLSKGDSFKKLPTPQPPDDERVARIFETYARFGETLPSVALGITSRNFVKLFKDCEMIDKKLTTTLLDLSFAKAKNAPGGIALSGAEKSNKLSWAQFQVAIELVAAESGTTSSALYAAMANREADGPVVTATIAGYNKFHDDRSTFPAVAQNTHIDANGERRGSWSRSMSQTQLNAAVNKSPNSRKASDAGNTIAAAALAAKASTASR